MSTPPRRIPRCGSHPQYGWEFPDANLEEVRKHPANALRANSAIPGFATPGSQHKASMLATIAPKQFIFRRSFASVKGAFLTKPHKARCLVDARRCPQELVSLVLISVNNKKQTQAPIQPKLWIIGALSRSCKKTNAFSCERLHQATRRLCRQATQRTTSPTSLGPKAQALGATSTPALL